MSKWTLIVDTVAGTAGAVLGFLYGEPDGIFIALLVFMLLDYITGVIIAIVNKKLSSEIGFKGLAKKLLILVFVAVGHIIDTYILGNSAAAMSAVILFYLSNEGISIVENAAELGLPVPQKIKSILQQLRTKGDKDNADKGN